MNCVLANMIKSLNTLCTLTPVICKQKYQLIMTRKFKRWSTIPSISTKQILHNTICVGHHYAQTNTINVNKTRALLQTTGDKDEPNIIFIQTSQHGAQWLDTTLCDKVCQWLATGRWFSLCTLIFSTNKTDRYDISEILLKVTLNTKTLSI